MEFQGDAGELGVDPLILAQLDQVLAERSL